MKVIRNIAVSILAVWLVFVTMGTTIYQHVCSVTGEVQISVNAPVDCKFEKPQSDQKSHCCVHHCKKEIDGDKFGKQCCQKSEVTIFVDVQNYDDVLKSLVNLDAGHFYVEPSFEFIKESGVYYNYKLRPPPSYLPGREILTLQSRFII